MVSTWPEALSVSYSNQTGVVYFGLQEETSDICESILNKAFTTAAMCANNYRTYRQRGIFIQFVFGGNAKASVVAASSPRQSYRSLQLFIHLLVN